MEHKVKEASNLRILTVDDNKDIHCDFRKVLCPPKSQSSSELEDLAADLFGDEETTPSATKNEMNYELDSAFQGHEAIEKVKQSIAEGRPYALIFMDVRMPPGMDGVEAIGEIWKIDPHVEIALCTAFMDYSHEEIVEKLGVSEKLLFIKKPFDEIAIKQMAMMATTKWNLGKEIHGYISSLEELVNDKTQMLLETHKFAALGEMAGGIAHEINTPLGVIQLLCNSLSKRCEKEEFEIDQVEKSVDKIVDCVGYISNVIKGLRNFSRTSEEDLRDDVAIYQVIDDTLFFCRERFKENDVVLKVDNVDQEITLTCNSTKISQVLLNLLNNSFDSVTKLEERWIQVGVQMNGEFLEISVTDSGGGIEQDKRKKLFDPFFTTKEIGSGTGLGLSICRGIIESHGGKIYLDTESKNTRFVVSLPAQKASIVAV